MGASAVPVTAGAALPTVTTAGVCAAAMTSSSLPRPGRMEWETWEASGGVIATVIVRAICPIAPGIRELPREECVAAAASVAERPGACTSNAAAVVVGAMAAAGRGVPAVGRVVPGEGVALEVPVWGWERGAGRRVLAWALAGGGSLIGGLGIDYRLFIGYAVEVTYWCMVGVLSIH